MRSACPNAPGVLHLRRPGGKRRGETDDQQRDECDHGERGSDRGQLAERPDRRSDDEPEDGEAENGAEKLSAALAGSRQRQPGESAGPRHRARDPLEEAGAAESCRGRAQCEGCRRDSEREQPERPPCVSARSWPPAGPRGCRRSSRLPRRRRPGARPASFESSYVSRQTGDQRHDRREQHRVGEHGHADDDEQTAHAAEHTDCDRARDRVRSTAEEQVPAQGHPGRTKENAPSRWPLRPAFPTDLRRSGCRSGSHQPPALRSRCTRESRGSRSLRQVLVNDQFPQIAVIRIFEGEFGVVECETCLRKPLENRVDLRAHKKCTGAVAPSSGFLTDLRRSECRSGDHQPQVLLPRCNHHRRRSERASQVPSGSNFPQIATISTNAA